jgi:hypothetical protein
MNKNLDKEKTEMERIERFAKENNIPLGIVYEAKRELEAEYGEKLKNKEIDIFELIPLRIELNMELKKLLQEKTKCCK